MNTSRVVLKITRLKSIRSKRSPNSCRYKTALTRSRFRKGCVFEMWVIFCFAYLESGRILSCSGMFMVRWNEKKDPGGEKGIN